MASPVFADDVIKFAFGSDAAPFAWEKYSQIYGLVPDIARKILEKSHGITVSFHLHHNFGQIQVSLSVDLFYKHDLFLNLSMLPHVSKFSVRHAVTLTNLAALTA